MSADVSRFPSPCLHCAANSQGASLCTVNFQSYSCCRTGRVINGVIDCNITILLYACRFCSAADNRRCIALSCPHNILCNLITSDLLAIDLSSHRNFHQMRTMGLRRNRIRHLSASNSGRSRAKRRSINRKVDSLGNIAIRSVTESDITVVHQCIVKCAFQIELDHIDRPVLCTDAANAICDLQLDRIITAVQVLSHIKTVSSLNDSLCSNFCVTNVPDASSRAGIIARIINRGESIIDYSRVACNNSQSRAVQTLDGNHAGVSTTAATAFNDDLCFHRTVFQQAQLGVLISDIILTSGIRIGFYIVQLLPNVRNVAIYGVNRGL